MSTDRKKPIPPDFLENAHLTLRKCGELYGVSTATVRRWKYTLQVQPCRPVNEKPADPDALEWAELHRKANGYEPEVPFYERGWFVFPWPMQRMRRRELQEINERGRRSETRKQNC